MISIKLFGPWKSALAMHLTLGAATYIWRHVGGRLLATSAGVLESVGLAAT
jgi:hypothetical protein